jgi:transcriptional regulator with XRE-family HTH domain
MKRTFREAFIEALEVNQVSPNKVSLATGVSVHQLKKLREGKSLSTNVDDAIMIARFFGATLDEFLADPSIKRDAELNELLMKLEPSERQFLLNAAKAQIASRDIPLPKSDAEEQ